MEPQGLEPGACHRRLRAPRWPVVTLVLATASLASGAQAQNYPWCANFADGAGVNCGFSSGQQCQLTAQGTGGYCEPNNVYRPAAAAPARHQTQKRREPKHS
jgi:Protein of unknown function (DUF3551)